MTAKIAIARFGHPTGTTMTAAVVLRNAMVAGHFKTVGPPKGKGKPAAYVAVRLERAVVEHMRRIRWVFDLADPL